jgi:hypothetical protein
MARKNADVVKLAILRYTGALGYGTAEMFNEAWDGMTGLFENYMESALPWREKDS